MIENGKMQESKEKRERKERTGSKKGKLGREEEYETGELRQNECFWRRC